MLTFVVRLFLLRLLRSVFAAHQSVLHLCLRERVRLIAPVRGGFRRAWSRRDKNVGTDCRHLLTYLLRVDTRAGQ